MANTKTQERPSLALVRKVDAVPSKVWRALTEPEMLKQWMAPDDAFKVPVAETQVRVGGRYHLVMTSPDGQEHDVSGVYREIVPNKKLVYTWAWKTTLSAQKPETWENLTQYYATPEYWYFNS